MTSGWAWPSHIAYRDPCDNVINDSTPSPATVVFRLCNFVTGQWDLLPDHQAELHHQILDTSWPHSSGRIDLIGYASKLLYAQNNPQSNDQLSMNRYEAVKNYLSTGLPPGLQINYCEGEGASQSQQGSLDAGFFRAVEVRLYAASYQKPPLNKKRQPIPHHAYPSNRFRFDPIQSQSGSILVGQDDSLLFKITDLTNGQSRYFRYAGLGVGLSPIPYGKCTGWNSPNHIEFETAIAIRNLAEFATFGATASLDQAGVGGSTPWGSAGPSGLRFSFTPEAYLRRGIFKDFSFSFGFSKGIGISAGVSRTQGSVTVMPPDFVPGPPGTPWG
jgi:hypothetical protein